MPSVVPSFRVSFATRLPLLSASVPVVRSSAGRFGAPARLGQVASPAASFAEVGAVFARASAVVASNVGPVVSLANWVYGPPLAASVVVGAARRLLLSMNTTPTRPLASRPRSIMSSNERSPVHVVPLVQIEPRWTTRWLTRPVATDIDVPRTSARASVITAAYVFQWVVGAHASEAPGAQSSLPS